MKQMEGVKNSEEIKDWEWSIMPFYTNVMRNMASSIAKDAVVTVNGEDYVYPIAKTVMEDTFFKHYIEIEDEPIGNIEKIVLRNENEIPLATGVGLIEKDDEGWHLAFKIYFEEKVMADDGQ